MGHFRVELHAVKTFFFVGHNGKRAGFGAGDGHKISRDGGHFIAMAHPYVQQRFTFCADRIFNALNQGTVRLNFYLRITEFTLIGTLNMAAKLHRHGLHTIANAQYRNAGFEDILRRARAILLSGAFRAAGKNNAVRIEFTNLCFSNIPCPQFAIHTQLTYATRHQLGILRTEIKDENAMLMNIVCH